MLSHNIVSAQGVKLINDSPIDEVLSTDTVINPHVQGHPKFRTVSVAPMFAETIIRFYNSQSINAMFSSLPEDIVQAGIDLAGVE